MGRLSDARKKAKKAGAGAPEPAATPAPEVPAAPGPLPASGLAGDILAGAGPAPAAPPVSLADEILAGLDAPVAPAVPAPPPAVDETGAEDFGGFAAPAHPAPAAGLPSSGLADELLASLAAAPAPAPKMVEDSLTDGVLKALESAADAAAPLAALGTSGLAEDVLPGRPKAKHHLGIDEIHEFEAFFENESQVEQLHLVLFHMDDEMFALDIDRVQEIIRVPGVTRVPHVADHVLGVCNLRGRIVPVMELRKLMRMPSRPADRLSRILVLDFGGKQIGMLVDRANEVAHIRVSDIEPPPEEVRAVDRNLVTAVARLNARMVFILDLDQILALK